MAVAPQRKRAALHTLGCRLNQSETNLLAEKLQAAGYDLVPFDAPADLAIVNTCTVTQEADAKSRKLVRQFLRRNPEAFTAVIGCYAQTGAEALAQIEGIDLIVGNQEKLNVLDHVRAQKNATPLIVRDKMDRDDFSIDFAGDREALTTRPNLKVQDGCDFMCSFCIIPFARGRARSRNMENLLDEARSLVERGGRELVLTGVNIGTYAFDGQGILDVVDRLNEIDGLDRIRISSIEPTTIPEALFERMNDPDHALTPYLHIPLQAGSDSVLAAMRRKYTRDEFLEFVQRAHECVRDICIGTDILVGFPGETEEDFEATCDALWRSPLVYAHVFKYSEREGTASLRIREKVSPQAMSERSARLRHISAEKRRMFEEHFLGCAVEVLFEQEDQGYWSGHTANFIKVAVASPQPLHNQLSRVVLEQRRDGQVYGVLADGPR
jgi:threonylcarbamoyladenosine tRNA methylthiotransferase MtaB